ncbi:MAG: hypothetical protein U9P38_09100 [Campylobacterota bacterium]|nr:hypothetical protein [Campylobacterota bacterium]
MSKFYLLLWLKWVIRVSLCSFIIATAISFIITLYIYVNLGMPILDTKVLYALFDVGVFWFRIIWSFSLLIALFRSVKYIFNNPTNSYEFKLLDCKENKNIEVIGYGDLVKVWRRWFMLLIWLVVVQMIITTFLLYILLYSKDVFIWFNIYWLFISILIAGYFSFILLSNRCKQVKIGIA